MNTSTDYNDIIRGLHINYIDYYSVDKYLRSTTKKNIEERLNELPEAHLNKLIKEKLEILVLKEENFYKRYEYSFSLTEEEKEFEKTNEQNNNKIIGSFIWGANKIFIIYNIDINRCKVLHEIFHYLDCKLKKRLTYKENLKLRKGYDINEDFVYKKRILLFDSNEIRKRSESESALSKYSILYTIPNATKIYKKERKYFGGESYHKSRLQEFFAESYERYLIDKNGDNFKKKFICCTKFFDEDLLKYW
ncbi:MAG: hypothetical protein E7E64_05045 [Clostridium celatum]|uniref:hypothetical protein n=1 Tax=Clostridium tertium TaxID=1559 RepID=UPI002900861C|nr:hypothetical protein [Clostridium celatum]